MSTSNFRKTVQQFIQLLEDEEHQLENKASNNEIANVEIEVRIGFR